jgi:hypothetical protein
MIMHLLDFFRRMLTVATPEPAPAPKLLRKPRDKKAAQKKAPARKKK